MPTNRPTEQQVRELMASIAATRSRGRYIPPSASETIVAICYELLRLREAATSAHAHCDELREAWRTGAIEERDDLGGTRSNRNVEVEVALRKALQEPPYA